MISELVIRWGIVAVFFLMVSNGFFSTPPSQVVLSVAGALTIGNNTYFIIMFFVVIIANYLGTTALYAICWYKGQKWYDSVKNSDFVQRRKLLNMWIPSSTSLIAFFNDRAWLVFACRLLSFIRSIISVPAGIAKMSFLKFTALTMPGIMIWAFIWMFTGRTVTEKASEGNPLVWIILVVLFVTAAIVGKIMKSKLNSRG